MTGEGIYSYWDKIRMHLSRFYIKRCIGMPGDTLCIRNAFYETNRKQEFRNLEDQQMIADYQGVCRREFIIRFPLILGRIEIYGKWDRCIFPDKVTKSFSIRQFAA